MSEGPSPGVCAIDGADRRVICHFSPVYGVTDRLQPVANSALGSRHALPTVTGAVIFVKLGQTLAQETAMVRINTGNRPLRHSAGSALKRQCCLMPRGCAWQCEGLSLVTPGLQKRCRTAASFSASQVFYSSTESHYRLGPGGGSPRGVKLRSRAPKVCFSTVRTVI